jgi:hypothetical protein
VVSARAALEQRAEREQRERQQNARASEHQERTDRHRDRLCESRVLVLVRPRKGGVRRDLDHVAAAAVADQADQTPALGVLDSPEIERPRQHRPREDRMARALEQRRVHVLHVAIEGLLRGLAGPQVAPRERRVAEVQVVCHHEIPAGIVLEEGAQVREPLG